MYGEESFGEVDRATMGLTELACEERAGVIFACLTPGKAFDIDSWLGEFADKLADQQLTNWHLYTERYLRGSGWKATMDGYLEVYHHDSVHGKTVGPYTVGNFWCTILGAHTNGWSLPEKYHRAQQDVHLRTGRA